jgi:hypothetical protein
VYNGDNVLRIGALPSGDGALNGENVVSPIDPIREQLSESEKLLELFKIIDDPDRWYDSLSYQQQILCKGWLLTGNRLFAKALLGKILPHQVDHAIRIAPLGGLSNPMVKFS